MLTMKYKPETSAVDVDVLKDDGESNDDWPKPLEELVGANVGVDGDANAFDEPN